MAKLIFDNNIFTEIHRMAESETFMDANKSFHNEHMTIIEINNTDFSNFKKGLSRFVSCDGTNVVWESITPDSITAPEGLQAEIDYYVDHLDNWIAASKNQNKPMWSDVSDFRDYIKGLNPSSIVTEGNPLNSTLVKYTMDQGEKAFHLFELL